MSAGLLRDAQYAIVDPIAGRIAAGIRLCGNAGFALAPAAVLVVVAAPLATAIRGRGDPIVAAGGAAFVVFAAHAGLDWDWEMPVVTLVALACAGVVLADRTGIGAVEP